MHGQKSPNHNISYDEMAPSILEAVYQGNKKIVQLLLTYAGETAVPQLQSLRCCVFELAALHGHREVIKLLFENNLEAAALFDLSRRTTPSCKSNIERGFAQHEKMLSFWNAASSSSSFYDISSSLRQAHRKQGSAPADISRMYGYTFEELSLILSVAIECGHNQAVYKILSLDKEKLYDEELRDNYDNAFEKLKEKARKYAKQYGNQEVFGFVSKQEGKQRGTSDFFKEKEAENNNLSSHKGPRLSYSSGEE